MGLGNAGLLPLKGSTKCFYLHANNFMVINAILVSSNFIVDGGKLPEKVQTNINVFQQTLKHFKRDQIAVFIVKSTLSTPIP